MGTRHKLVHSIGVVLLLGTFLAMFPVSAPSVAQGPEPAWQPTNLPAGGWVQDLVTHPAAPGRIYALLQATGPFRSDDGGLTWQRIASGLPFEPTAVRLYNTLTVDPANPDVLYLGLGASGFSAFAHVYRSTDGGASWVPRGNGIPAVEVNDIAISPQNPQILYAATHDGVYRSTDGGANWQSRGHSGSWVRAVAVHPANADRVIILIGSEVHASDDGGASWHAASAGLPVGSGSSPSARLIFDPAMPGTAYLTGLIVKGFHRSIDGGETWTAVNNGFGTVIPTLTGIALRPGTATEIYVATASGVYRLDGSSWTRLSLDLEAKMANFPNALGLDAASGTFFLGYWHGVYRSTDGGANWAPTGPGLNSARVEAVGVDPDNGQRVFAAAGNRLFRSTDGGVNWTPALPRETVHGYMVAIDPHNTNHMYYSVHLAPLRHSLDGGLTWTDAPSAASLPYDVRSIRFHRTDPQRLYLVGPHNFSSHTTAQGVYKSTDGGQTWQHLEDQLRAIELALSADGATVYAASISQIIRTVDDGATWTQAHGGLPPGWGFVHGLEAHPIDPNVAWVATGGAGVFRTADRGATWQPMNDGLPGGYVTDLAARPANGDAVLYAGTRFGVYVSRSGQPWVPLGTGLPDYAQWTNSLAVTPSGRVYVGTDFGGLWTLQDGGGVEPPDPCRGIPLGRGQIWLAETGFAVQGMWLDWFNDHGGLDILGFPRSPVTADPMDPEQCVQYFQRGVLEWHPENPDPWRIQRRLLVDIMMPGIDPAVSPARGNGADYWYFPQTRHAVSNYAPNGAYIGFKWFFDRQGREDTFGYPLEEPKLRRGQDGIERWTQRFQAALFEYHPEYDIPGLKPGTNIPWRNWIVELGLLGDQYIAQNGLSFGVTCSQPPMLGFGKVWHDHARVQQRLGCPTGLEVGQTIVEQSFQHGWMFRRDDTDQIYAVRDTGAWSVYPDTWQPGEPEIDPTINVPAGVYQPRQGLGKVWRMLSHPPVYDGGGLYWAVTPDRAFRGSAQNFEHGTMIWSDRRVIYVFYDNGTWESYVDYFGETPVPPATATPMSTPTLQPTATVEPAPTDTPLPSPNAGVYAVAGVKMDDVLNARLGPGVEHAITGVIPPYGTGIQTFGQGEQVGSSLWILIQYEGSTGWVNSRYLARQVGQTDDSLAARATTIVQAIGDKDWETLSGFVHPDKGLRFSPYTFVRVEPDANQEQDLVFGAAQVMSFAADQTVYRWGRFDGTGEPIELMVDAYWSEFIYDADFWQPHVIGYGEFVGTGNTINNIAQVYPQAVTVEYHFTGFDPQYEGFDWRSLRLVLEEQAGIWYLVGIVHDEWTI